MRTDRSGARLSRDERRMLMQLLHNVAISLSIAALPLLSLLAAFPALFVSPRSRSRSLQELAVRGTATLSLLTILVVAYPQALVG
jgi:hypothetical protein